MAELKWSAVLDDRYRKSSPAQRERVQKNYFEKVIWPKFKDKYENKNAAKKDFYEMVREK